MCKMHSGTDWSPSRGQHTRKKRAMVSGQELKMLDSVSGKMLMHLAFFHMLPSGEEDCLFSASLLLA